jgi:rhamnosyltransferase
MKIDIICLLYNAEKYILNLNNSLLMQKKVHINKIKYILTESIDKTEEMLKEIGASYKKISKNEFSHSLTRENAAKKCTGDIIVYITQDVIIESDNWLYELVIPIIEGKVQATYSRQITKYNNIEKYIREFNYPTESHTMSIENIKTNGLKTFFFSDASSAIDRKVFSNLNYYDAKKLPISEDMYIAYKLIINNYKIKYCADSIVYHSHKFTLKEIYNRYKLTGKFFKENSYLDNYGTTNSGAKLAKYVLKRIIQEHRLDLLFRYPFDMAARLLGMKAGTI